ncbi:MAG: competence/damage-inducible protein A [Candidatus Thorarchaeota archaeon]|nr:MAG: competence/damage-inducible protein A [Candidatus Thorarchaeota archaeon]RLI58146.1 MAG: competence/damage-inducible protein A [Candidatus Thorarchaeota archaeon]
MMEDRNLRTVGLVVIGNEVLDGIVLDTNSNWMELRLTALGLEVKRLVSVRDQLDEIGEALRFVCDACDVVITTGGLGPTHDDMTLHAVALALGVETAEHPEAIAIVERQYKNLYERGIVKSPDITPSRRKMARLPLGGVPLDNTVGGAPGVRIDHDGTTIFCLPGVPSELKFIFEDSLVPWLRARIQTNYVESIVEFDINDESVFSPAIDKVMKKYPEVYIKSMPKTYGTTWTLRIWLSARGADSAHLQDQITKAKQYLEDITGIISRPVE